MTLGVYNIHLCVVQTHIHPYALLFSIVATIWFTLKFISKNGNFKLLLKLLIESITVSITNKNPEVLFLYISPSFVEFLPLCKKCLKLRQY